MAGTYPDGFPLDPTQAVQVCDFLSVEEKQEWMQWLNTASPDDKVDLVNTLHEIWIENKRTQTVAPASTPAAAVEQQSQPQQPQATFTPPPVQQQPIASQPVPAVPIPQTPPPQFQPAPASAVTQQQPVQQQPQQPVQKQPDVSQQLPPQTPSPQVAQQQSPAPAAQPAQIDDKIPQYGMPMKQVQEVETPDTLPPRPIAQPQPKVNQPKYSFKQIDEMDREEKRDFQQNRSNPQKQQWKNNQQNQQRFQQNSQSNNQNTPRNEQTSKLVQLDNMQSRQTRSILDTFVNDFQSNRQNEEKMIGKLKDAVLAVEGVANFADAVAEKVYKLNEQQVTQAKSVTAVKEELKRELEEISDRIEDILGMVERTQDDLERATRRHRAFEQDVKEVVSQINETLAGISSDQFTGADKIAILASRLDRIEKVTDTQADSKKLTGSQGNFKPIKMRKSTK